MNKVLRLAHWLLVVIAIVSLVAAGRVGLALWQDNKINHFISNVSEYEQVPEHAMAQFAQAYNEAELGKSLLALDRLTKLVTTDDLRLQATAYFNRGNLHLREAQALAKDNAKRSSLIELAKQDYRSALLLDSSLWDVRFNLELALLMAPEQPADAKLSDKKKTFSRKIKTVGFRVDLP
ncbi:MAG: MxaK protein [Gammaproteobacteria bacterium]|nr:MxaK protein [Gammaproteobacteria bacterium]